VSIKADEGDAGGQAEESAPAEERSTGSIGVVTDPELTRLSQDAHRANEALIKRLERYQELVPARPDEAALADEVVGFARFAERQFRGWYERCRDMREMLEDPDLRVFPGRKPSDPDPRGD